MAIATAATTIFTLPTTMYNVDDKTTAFTGRIVREMAKSVV